VQDVEAVRVLLLDWELEVDYAGAGGGDFELRNGEYVLGSFDLHCLESEADESKVLQ